MVEQNPAYRVICKYTYARCLKAAETRFSAKCFILITACVPET